MLTKILIVLAAAIGVFLIIVATRPADFRITRSATFAAPPAAIFAQVNDFHLWEAWSPWAKLDPAAKNSFAGPASGAGSKFAWTGNNEVGEGRMEITESRPDSRILINLDFIKPFQASNLTEFTFTPQGDQTVIQWTMSGKNNFMAKAVSLFMDCDKMVGGQFEQGLVNMKSIVEKPSNR